MDWARFQAALIRFFWATVFPLIGVLVTWLANGQNLQDLGVQDAFIASLVGGILYGIKKIIWPDTTL